MASSRRLGVVAASAALLLAALVSTVAGDASCFKDYAIGRLYKTKYEVCNGDNTVGCKYPSLSFNYYGYYGTCAVYGPWAVEEDPWAALNP